MQIRETLELALLVVDNAQALVATWSEPHASQLESYWLHSKQRLDQWARALKQAQSQGDQRGTISGLHSTASLQSLLEEIVATELLTRAWTAVLTLCDRRWEVCEYEPVARSALIGHLEARHRVMQLLAHSDWLPMSLSVSLNRLRHRVERWTDTLVGYLLPWGAVDDLASDPRRAREIAEGFRSQSPTDGRRAWNGVLAGLRLAIGQTRFSQGVSRELNSQISASIVACLPAQAFDDLGLLSARWRWRLEATAADSQVLIREYLGLPAASPRILPNVPGRQTPRRFR